MAMMEEKARMTDGGGVWHEEELRPDHFL